MSSVTPFLDKRPNSKNLHPITIRIIKDRKPSYIYLGQAIKMNQWDTKNCRVKKSHPDYLEINQLIINKLSNINKSLINSEIANEYITSKKLKKKIILKDSNSFFDVADKYLDTIRSRKKFHQFDIEKSRIKVFKEFVNKDKLCFEEITITLLKEYEVFLIDHRKITRRTIVNYMIGIRTIFNLGISSFEINSELYPFGRGKYQIKFPETKKIGLTKEEISVLENIKGLTKAQEYALSVWLLSFYFAGIRISDVLQLKWSDFSNNRLYYRMGKNTKLVSLKTPMKVLSILDGLERTPNSVFLFKELEGIDIKDNRLLRTRIKTATRNFNRRLEIIAQKAGIDKNLSMHIARHSFGNISGDRIPIQMLQKLYRHSSITTTIMYQSSFMQKDTDEALERVINF